ncbi:MAG: DUF4340 domain-containing protein [Acidihalobacter sp.]|jgi:hypothetical protein
MFNRRLLLNLALLLLVAGLALFIFYPRPKPAPQGFAVAPDVDTTAVRHIRIERHGRPSLVFERKNGDWRLTAPISARVNPLMMRTLLQLPHERSTKRYAAAGLDVSRYGLKPPRASVYFGSTRIDLGSDNPINQLRYVLSGGELYLVTDRLSTLPEGAAANWVNLALLPPQARIVRLQLPSLDIRAKQPAGWVLQPEPAHYSADQVAALLNAWQHATALQLSAAPGTPASTQGDVRIELAGGTRLHLQIVATKPQLVLRNPALGVEYRLPGVAAGRLLGLSANDGRASAGSG